MIVRKKPAAAAHASESTLSFVFIFLITLDGCSFLAHCCHYYAIRCICGILIVAFFLCRMQSKVKKHRCFGSLFFTPSKCLSMCVFIKCQKKANAKVDSCCKVRHVYVCAPGIWHNYSMSTKNAQNLNNHSKMVTMLERQSNDQIHRFHFAKHVPIF